MATRKKQSASPISVTQAYLLKAVGEAEKVAGLQKVVIGLEQRISTGSLAIDLLLGHGGLAPGMYTFAGGEQSAKTTTQIVCMAASIDQDVGLRVMIDAEGSSGNSTDYVQNIVDTVRRGKRLDVEDLFGALDAKGNYLKPPIVVYKDNNELESIMNFLAALFRRLPDKRYEDNQWWYIFADDKRGQKMAADMGVEIDIGRSKASGRLMAPAPNGAPQALVLVDGWAALLPESVDEDEGKGGIGIVARKFSENLPKVVGKLRSKRVILIGTNLLREKPMVMFGSPFYESGGNALKGWSSVRIWHTPRALSGAPYSPKGKGQIEEESSVEHEGAMDVYRYVHLRAVKNKLGVPGRESFMRIWVSDGAMRARGVCPVFDTYHVLMETGQVSGKRSSMKLNIEGLGETKKNLSWSEFKTLILGSREQVDEILTKIGYRTGIDLRKGLFKLSAKGRLEELYVQHRTGGSKNVASADEESDAVEEIEDEED
jgi:RecA/RadA recombinase